MRTIFDYSRIWCHAGMAQNVIPVSKLVISGQYWALAKISSSKLCTKKQKNKKINITFALNEHVFEIILVNKSTLKVYNRVACFCNLKISDIQKRNVCFKI